MCYSLPEGLDSVLYKRSSTLDRAAAGHDRRARARSNPSLVLAVILVTQLMVVLDMSIVLSLIHI